MKLREQLMTMRRWETATMMFILGVQMLELEKSDHKIIREEHWLSTHQIYQWPAQ